MKKITALGILTLLFAGCAQIVNHTEQPIDPETSARVFGLDLPENARDPQRLNVLFDEQTALELENLTGEDGLVHIPEVKSFQHPGIVQMRRLFPHAGKFEARTRREGLHRWYEVYYDESVSLTKAAVDWTLFPGAEMIEFNPLIHIVGDPAIVSEEPHVSRTTASKDYPFDDPRLPLQWHYLNKGTESSSVSGCDINVIPVWKKYTTGNASVVVGIVDGGIDYSHEDLAANMWENPEKTGNSRFGYNFVKNNYLVTADEHGTHVAGTIAAVNNNGIGVSGIAGGNAAEGVKGVRLMSCQIFEGKESGSGPAAIKWSADHGAIISQNSWGYKTETTTPLSLIGAVDYFIKYAGIDEDGNQVGPMKGGIVIFAAGNENQDVSGNDYGPIFNVASVGADYRRAYYSNYGDWVDISAPGGDARKGNQVLSTIPGNKYGVMQGTSMACPHVSGVAALLVSLFGGEGFTPAELEQKMTESATPLKSFNKSFLMGAGLVNAYKAIAGSGGAAPEAPGALTVSAQSNNLQFSVRIPKDPDDQVPTSIMLYYKTSDFPAVSDEVMFAQFYLEDEKAGDILNGTITGLDFNQRYYVAAAAADLAGNVSPITERIVVTTGGNTKPAIHPASGTSITLKPYQSGHLDFEVSDPDGHFFTIDLERESEGVVLDTLVRNMPRILFSGPEIPSGSHTAKLIVTDSYGASTSQSMTYTVLENHVPVVVSRFEDRVFNSRAAVTEEFNSTDYFQDEDGEELAYAFSFSNESVINMTYQNGKFFLTPMNFGYSDITITGTDVRGATATQTFRVLIRDGERELDVYPNPVSDYLYVRTSSDASATLKLVGVNGATVYEETLSITPFDPARVDVHSLAPGIYTLTLEYGEKVITQSVVKL